MPNQVKNVTSISNAIRSFNKPSLELPRKEAFINHYQGFRVEIANTVSKLMDAAHLAYKRYVQKSFVPISDVPFVFNEWDFSDESVCLVVYNEKDNCVATMTVVKDIQKLPSDITFHEEINAMRLKGKKICEFTRFVIDDVCKNSKEVLITIMEWAYLTASYHFKATDVIIEVNPRHKTFYMKKFCFTPLTVIKDCPLVNDAPAILLNLSMNLCKQKLVKIDHKVIYSEFRSLKTEPLYEMISFISKESRKITIQNKSKSLCK